MQEVQITWIEKDEIIKRVFACEDISVNGSMVVLYGGLGVGTIAVFTNPISVIVVEREDEDHQIGE